jgi:hypothetical protein
MIRNLKVLGLAMFAVFAFAAMSAAGASAQTNGKITSTGSVTLDATATGAGLANSLVAFGGSVQCPSVLYTGHEEGSLTNRIPSGSSSATITPHYNTCTAFGAPATVDMNGCDYVFHLKETVTHEGVSAYRITATVEGCETGKTPVVTIFGSATKHANNEPFCEVEVTPETDPATQTLVARDTGNGFLDITGTVEGLAAHKRRPPGGNSILCIPETTTTGVLHVDVTVSGTNAGGTATAISLSH